MKQSNRHLSSLFRRCLQCPDETPTCPSCARDETCVLQSLSCEACPSANCVKVGTLPGQSAAPKPSSTPAIAGGVVGGVVVIILITSLIWWFCIRQRRQEWDDKNHSESDHNFQGVEKRDQLGLNRDARESMRSTGSIASTVRTRASNVIQIAYIPGVTNRSPTESPGLTVPPVPSVRMGATDTSTATSPNFEQDRYLFMPNDLRDSTYSDLSAGGRQSLSPSLARASNATTLYRTLAEVSPRPAVQALRAKAAVVTVNKSGNNSPDSPTPDDTALSIMSPSPKGMMNSPIVARNVSARPIQVKRSTSTKKAQIPTLANLQAVASNTRVSLRAQPERIEDRSEDEADASTHLMTSTHISRPRHQSTVETIIEDTPALKQSHFSNTTVSSTAPSIGSFPSPPASPLRQPPNQRPTRTGPSSIQSSFPTTGATSPSSTLHKKSGSLNSLIEEAMSRAAMEPVHGGLGSINENHQNHPMSRGGQGPEHGHGRSESSSLTGAGGPFSDANELREGSSR